MEKHKSINFYVGLDEGGCVDAGRLKLDGFVLLSNEDLQKLESENQELKIMLNMVKAALSTEPKTALDVLNAAESISGDLISALKVAVAKPAFEAGYRFAKHNLVSDNILEMAKNDYAKQITKGDGK